MLGANGAVGTCLVQAATGAVVVAVVSDGRAEHRLRALGADVVVVAEAAEWINERRPSVAVGMVMSFAAAGQAHQLVESGLLPRGADGIVGRIVLEP